MPPTAISAIAEINPDFATQLRSYLMKPVIQQVLFNINCLDCDKKRRIREYIAFYFDYFDCVYPVFIKYSSFLVDRKTYIVKTFGGDQTNYSSISRYCSRQMSRQRINSFG